LIEKKFGKFQPYKSNSPAVTTRAQNLLPGVKEGTIPMQKRLTPTQVEEIGKRICFLSVMKLAHMGTSAREDA